MAELEPRYVKIYCRTAAQRELERTSWHRTWTVRQKRSLGLSLAEKVDGDWRCRCCGKSVRVTW